MSFTAINEEAFSKYRKQAIEANLEGKNFLTELPSSKIDSICNGIGPEWFPSPIRKLIDALHPSLIVVSMIHDIMYYFGDGTDADFRKANLIFKHNGYKMADFNYPWYSPSRYKVRFDAWKFGVICDKSGKIAYNSAIQDRIKDTIKETITNEA